MASPKSTHNLRTLVIKELRNSSEGMTTKEVQNALGNNYHLNEVRYVLRTLARDGKADRSVEDTPGYGWRYYYNDRRIVAPVWGFCHWEAAP